MGCHDTDPGTMAGLLQFILLERSGQNRRTTQTLSGCGFPVTGSVRCGEDFEKPY